MGGKSKQSQRVKNNARPSNSSRAAELLGSNVPSFVGFAAHPDLGIIPVAPGLSTAEFLPEVFDSTISGEYQLLLKKLGKKDPITKAKALQEFTDRITKSEVDEVKAILPLWPKYYQSLSNDIDHKVRELTQNAQAAIANKVGKAMAPYLKQLAPVWISSQFDNYAPVASAATTTFKSSFSSNKVQEVFVFCQNEIIDYLWKNLTFHSASTLSNTKSYSAEDAENKYQRVIICSLRSLALFLEQINGKSTLEVKEKLSNLIQNQKYWSFSKHKVPNIRAAWFEALYSYLQNASDLTETNRNQVIQITFQNMDTTDPLVSPYIWGCILLIQTVFDNWYDSVNFQKVLQPKLNYLLKNCGSSCASIIYPNLLPFLSKFTDKTLSHCSLHDFYNNFFNNFKESLTHKLNSGISKSDASAIVSAFYECIRYVIQSQASDFKINDDFKWNFCKSIVNDHVVDVVKWNIVNENITTKFVFTHISSLIAYWSQNSNFDLYFHLLETFWAQILKLIVENEELEENVESYVKQFVEFIQTLYNAVLVPYENKVKFSDEVKAVASSQKSRNSTSVLHKDLRQIAIKLSKLLLERMSKEKSTTYIVQLKTLADLFEDSDFYAQISTGNSLQSAANNIFDILQVPEQISETTVDILFQILMLLENAERNKYLNRLLKLPNKKIQQLVLQRLLSYPLCVEAEVREILSQDHVTDLIENIAFEVITEKSKDKFNLLHKCFFQIDSGEILINAKTVEGITRIMSEPLVNDSMREMIDTCGSFIAQIMPVICSNNSTRNLQSDIFIKLFKFSINRIESDYLSEDTLWEVTTCWQDALSSNDITMNDVLFLECCKIIDNRVVNSQDITVPDIYNIADMAAKLILCSTENEENEEERYKKIDSMITKLETSSLYIKYFETSKSLCTYFELIKGQRTINSFIGDYIPELTTSELLAFFRKEMLNFSVIFKLTFNVRTEKHVALNTEGEDDQENTDDYFDSSENLLKTWSDVIYYNILKGINIVAIGESLKLNSHLINTTIWEIISKLLEKTLFVLKNASDDVAAVIKEKLFQLATFNVEKGDISWCRAVPYLNSLNQYGKDGNGFILLYEDSINAALDKNNYLAYVNITHSMLDKLEPKCLPINYNILEDHVDLIFKETSLRLLLANHFTGDYSNMSDQKLIAQSLDLITEVSARQQSYSEFLLYRQAIDSTEFDKIATVVEFMNFLNEVLKHFPTELNLKHWDLIRLSLSSWVLSVSSSVTKFNNPQVAMFIASVYRLHSTLVKFITEEKTKSSTELLTNVIDEWDNLFSKEVNLVLFKSFYHMISNCGKSCLPQLLEEICQYAEQLDYKLISNACDSGFKISIDDVINVALENLSNQLHEIRVICVYIINEVAKYLIPKNMEKLEKQIELVDQTKSSGDEKDDWHFLHKFSKHLEKYEANVKQYVEEFSCKLTELSDLQPIQRDDALPYLFLWNGIIHACSTAPAELRSQYALWITENKYEHIYLNFLFRAMPVEILKNHDSKVMNNDIFKPITWSQFKGHSTTVERYACYFYMQTLKYLPAVVRKWWNTTHTRQKIFVDKLTTNFVSNLICHDELRAITNKKEKHENMQVTVHTSTREVAAVYSIDEARMELVITLAPNHPLGAVKVEIGKQIGGRAQSRNVGMQLTIFLTHQNGSIFDGLSLWKKNLDKKFEGVEECYVCYTVIHQDTCQLPKLSCRTCKKKFHGPCLYKWFTTSSKSTCPICRNVF